MMKYLFILAIFATTSSATSRLSYEAFKKHTAGNINIAGDINISIQQDPITDKKQVQSKIYSQGKENKIALILECNNAPNETAYYSAYLNIENKVSTLDYLLNVIFHRDEKRKVVYRFGKGEIYETEVLVGDKSHFSYFLNPTELIEFLKKQNINNYLAFSKKGEIPRPIEWVRNNTLVIRQFNNKSEIVTASFTISDISEFIRECETL